MRKGVSQISPSVRESVRFTGIHFAAKKLGVSVVHLRLVLKGDRASEKLTARVRAKFPALLGGAK
jgi:hypothetical protein